MSGHKKRVITAIVILLASLCGQSNHADGAECAESRCVGLILPLSVHGEFGVAVRNGITLAQEHGSIGSRSISFLTEDSAFDSTRAIASLTKLVTVDGVKVVYILGGPLSDAVAPLADRLKVVTIVSSNEPALPIRYRHIIRFANPARDFGSALRRELEDRKLFRVGLVITENPYMNSLLEALRAEADQRFSFTELHRAGGDTMDFRSIVSRVRLGNFDVLGVLVHPGQIRLLYRQLAEQRVAISSFGVDALESESEVRESGEAIKGAFFVNHPVSDDFRGQYAKRFGNDNLIAFAAWGYDLALVLQEALRSISPSATTEQVLAALEQEREYQGGSGTLRFVRTSEGDRYFSFPLTVKEVH